MWGDEATKQWNDMLNSDATFAMAIGLLAPKRFEEIVAKEKPKMDWYNWGKQQFKEYKPRPPEPPPHNHMQERDAAWFGWMMERAHQIDFISKFLKVTHKEKTTEEVQRIIDRAIEELDARHGLEGKYDA